MQRMQQAVLFALFVFFLPATSHTAEQIEPAELIGKNVGTWDGELKLWIAGPKQPPVSGSFVERTRLLRDGLWIVSDFTLEVAGLTIEGASQFGYDTQKKKLVGSMIESSNSQLAVYEGAYDPATKTTTFTADVYDPLFTKTVTRKLETRFDSGDRRTATLSIAPLRDDKSKEQKFVKVIEIVYTRRP